MTITDLRKQYGTTQQQFAEKLKTAREAAGLTQQAMSDRMEIPKRSIESWEGGQRTPPTYVQRFVLNELEGLREGTVNG